MPEFYRNERPSPARLPRLRQQRDQRPPRPRCTWFLLARCAKIHDDLLAAGTDPDQSGTLFHDLYTSDDPIPRCTVPTLLQPPSMPPSMVALRSVSPCQAASTPAQVRPCSWQPRTRCSTRPRRGRIHGRRAVPASTSAVVGGDLLALFSDDVLENVSAFSSRARRFGSKWRQTQCPVMLVWTLSWRPPKETSRQAAPLWSASRPYPTFPSGTSIPPNSCPSARPR